MMTDFVKFKNCPHLDLVEVVLAPQHHPTMQVLPSYVAPFNGAEMLLGWC